MAINFTGSVLSIGNSVFGLNSTKLISLWGATFVDNRYLLLLIHNDSDDTVVWKRVDTLSPSTLSYDMPYAPSFAGVATTDRSSAKRGNFLYAEGEYFYYLKGGTIVRTVALTGAPAGTQVLRKQNGTAFLEDNLDQMTVKSPNIYITSKADQKIYRFVTTGWAWDGGTKNATIEVAVPEFATDTLCASFIQAVTVDGGSPDDFVVMLKGNAKLAYKFTSSLAQRKGTGSYWTDPSLNIVAGQFRGTLLYLLSNDNSVAGSGILIYRFADSSTDIVDKATTVLSVSSDRVKAGSGTVVQITFEARDGYGLVFSPAESVRFSLVRHGDEYDKSDGALADSPTGPFRGASGVPYNVSLDAPFDENGIATCYWQSPETVPVEEVLHRIKVKYPIF